MLNKVKTFLLTTALIATTALSAQAFNAGAVGPVNLQDGFPTWWQDDAGFRISLCLDAACGPDPVNAASPFSRQVGFKAEAFWWISNAINWQPAGNTAGALMEQAMEAAWFGEDPIDGQQLPFARIRVRANVAGASTSCTVTTPYGAFIAPIDGGVRAINFTQDVAGGPAAVPPFSEVLVAAGPDTTNITHFLTLGIIPVKGAVFAGTGAIAAATAANPTVSITCNAADAFGPGISTITTSEFDTAGFAFNDGNNVPPVAHSDVAATAVATPITINLTANDVDIIDPLTNVHGVNPLAIGLGAAPPFVIAPGDPANAATPGMPTAQGGRVAKNADGTVTYRPAAAFSGVDSFPYVIQDTGGCISGQIPVPDPHPLGTGGTICLPSTVAVPNPPVAALAIITVEQATAQASFRAKVQKWDISGATSIANLSATDATGNNILFTKLVGAQEVPPQVSAGSGDVSVTLRTDAVLGQVIDYSLTYTGLTGVTQSHIHSGAFGINGPPHVFLCSNTVGGTTPACPAAGGTVTGTLAAANFTAGGTVADFPALLAAIQAGTTYVNVHTTAVASGEIRGQLGRNVVAVHAGPTTAAPLIGVMAIPPLTAQTSPWALPAKLDAVPSADRTVTIQTSAGSTVTVPLKLK